MSGTIDYFEDIVECKNCGEQNQVNCISDTESGETLNEVVAGQKCTECGTELKF